MLRLNDQGTGSTERISARDVCGVLFRHKRKMCWVFGILTAVAFTWTVVSASMYRSEAKLLLKLGRETATLDPIASTGERINVSQTRESQRRSELEIVRSRELAERVVATIGADTILRKRRFGADDGVAGTFQRELAIKRFRKLLDTSLDEESDIIRIAYAARTPELAQRALNTLIDAYLEKHLSVHMTEGSYDFFVAQTEHLRESLARAEQELQELKDETGISSVDGRRQVMLAHAGDLERSIGRNDAALAASTAKVGALEETLSTVPQTLVIEEASGFPNVAADALRQRLYELKLRERELLADFPETSRPVLSIREQIADAEALLQAEEPTRTHVTTGISDAHSASHLALLNEQATLASLLAEAQALDQQLIDMRVALEALNDGEARILRLEREIGIQEASYQRYSQNLEQARIDRALEAGKISSIRIVQAATFVETPVGPNRKMNLMLGMLLAAIAAIGVAFGAEYVDHSIRTPDESEARLQLPTLACIPWASVNRVAPLALASNRRLLEDQKATPTPADRWLLPSAVRDRYGTLGHHLQLEENGTTTRPQVIAVTGCHRGEGVSTVAANLAVTLAQQGEGTVLLVDADLRHPSVHRIFQRPLSPGLTGVLAEEEVGVCTGHRSPVANLELLPAGATNGYRSDLINVNKFGELLTAIRREWRFAVIDLPPLSVTESTVPLASLCDGVVLVVEAERLRWEVPYRAKEELERANANVLGVVLTKRRFHIPGWVYRRI